MAIPIADFTPLVPSAAAGDYTVDVSGLGAVADDYVVCFIACSSTSGTISENSGGATTWSLTTLYVATGTRMVVARAKVAAGPTISNPRFALSAGTGLWQGAIVAVRDADADNTAVIDGSSTDDPGANVSTRATAAMTPTNDNSLVFYFISAITSTGPVATRFLPSDVVGQVIQGHDNGTSFMNIAIGTVQQTTKAATSKTYYSNISSRTGAIVIAFKNKASGQISPHGTAGFTKVAWLGDFGALHDSTLTWGAPDNGGVTWDGAGAIGAYAVSSDATTAVSAAPIAAPWGNSSRISSAVNSAGIWVGRKASFSAAVNMSGKQFYSEWYFENIGVQVGTEGLILAFKDSSGYWAAFQLALKSALVVGRLYTSVIDVDTVTPYASGGGGSINWADITSITPLYHRAGSSGTGRNINFRNWALLSRTTLVGAGAIRPLTIGYARNVLNGWGMVGCVEKLGETVLPKCDIQIGDGTFPTYYDSSATGVTYEGAFSALSQPAVNIAASGIEFRIKASSSDTIIDAASATTAKLAQGWVIDSASSGSATYSFVGKVISGMASPTLLAGETFTSMTFSECGPVQTKGASLTSCTVSATTASSTEAAVVADANGGTFTNTTIDGTGAGYALELGTAVTAHTLTDCTLTAGTTDKVHVKATTGTVTITISGTTSLIAADVTTDGATVVIAAPQPTLSATVLASSRVVLYNNTTDAEMDNTAPGGTSWSKVITSGASANDSLTLHVFKEGYQEFQTTFLYTGEDTTILVTQEVDSNIASLRTELGITDYTTITEFALDVTGNVEIDADDADGSTTKARLAIWYNGVLTTENGARYLRGAITILSTAAFRINTSILDLKIENISVTYGLNFTDTERRLYRDDGAPIYAAVSAPGSIQNDYSGVPDTVETGVSGLTGSESAQLMALPTATTIAAAVWAYVITGSTTAVQMMRGFAAVLLGKVSGAGTGTETFRDIADTTDVVVATVDSDGNRTAITRDLT